MTARDYVEGPWLEWLPRLSLRKFDPEQIEMLVTKWLAAPDERAAFWSQLDAVRVLHGVMQVPLLATITLLVYRQRQTLPASRARLFEMFVELLSEGWDLARRINRGSRFGSAVKEVILQQVAWRSQSSRSKHVSESVLDDIASSYLKKGQFSTERKALLEEIMRDGLLIRSGDRVEFAHMSFQEFLAAQSLLGEPTGKTATGVLKQYLAGDDWWSDVLRFYIGLSGKPKELAAWIDGTMQRVRGNSATLALAQRDVLFAEIRKVFPDLDEST
jgi:predicted NACHT family NTPase